MTGSNCASIKHSSDLNWWFGGESLESCWAYCQRQCFTVTVACSNLTASGPCSCRSTGLGLSLPCLKTSSFWLSSHSTAGSSCWNLDLSSFGCSALTYSSCAELSFFVSARPPVRRSALYGTGPSSDLEISWAARSFHLSFDEPDCFKAYASLTAWAVVCTDWGSSGGVSWARGLASIRYSGCCWLLPGKSRGWMSGWSCFGCSSLGCWSC